MKRSSRMAAMAAPFLLCASAAAMSQTPSPPPFSLSGTYRASAAMLGFERQGIDAEAWTARAAMMASADLKLTARFADQERVPGHALPEPTTAWVVGANYSLASGSLQVGYGRLAPEGAAGTRQFSIGYEYAVSKRLSLFADMAETRSAMRIRHLDLGVRAAF
ncbi:MAG: porin [Pseudomonadota bacterium]